LLAGSEKYYGWFVACPQFCSALELSFLKYLKANDVKRQLYRHFTSLGNLESEVQPAYAGGYSCLFPLPLVTRIKQLSSQRDYAL